MLFTGSRYIVAGVTLLIAYIAITSQVFVFIPWLMSISVRTTFQVLVPFNIGVVFIYWHYYLACTTEPGTTPLGWGEDNGVTDEKKGTSDTMGTGEVDDVAIGRSTALEGQDVASEVRDRSTNNKDAANTNTTTTTATAAKEKKKKAPLPRYCKNCEAFKPPRSHHCRICKKCVLKMDHHCPWINNCVGHYNYGHFLRFITWVTLTTGACMVLLLARVWDAIQNETRYMYRDDGPTKSQIIFLAVNILVDGGVLLAVGILCIYHLWCLVSNTSTIEVWEQEKVDAMVKKGKLRKSKFPYDVGCLRNYRQILGNNILLWLWPQAMQGSGTEYAVTDDKDAATVWPPREYHTSKRQARTFVSEYASSSAVHRRGGSGQNRQNRNLSTLSTPMTPDNNNQGRRSQNPSRASNTASAPHFPTHVRRGSEGWIVQDLTVQQRADLYDRQLRYEQIHGHAEAAGGQAGVDDDEEDYQEGLSDIEGDVYSQLPGGMQGNQGVYEDYNDDADYDDDEEEASSDDVDDLPYDVASDEWDDDGYEEDDRYDDEGDGSDMDQHNPYLAYADEGEEGDYNDEEAIDMDDEVTLKGKNRHRIGRFFDSVGLTGGSGGGEEVDEWDEGEGLDVGCRPPGLAAKGVGIPETPFSTGATAAGAGQKTFYTMILEREQALKAQIAAAGGAVGPNKSAKNKNKSK
ncbi:MAG: DHHC palmitoyltransferase-domain-containing protein [Linnemannia gamsii]|nr:MAG: DHHC palmitoyltransferase-domain-containing protein [Linnemannia gamsii]